MVLINNAVGYRELIINISNYRWAFEAEEELQIISGIKNFIIINNVMMNLQKGDQITYIYRVAIDPTTNPTLERTLREAHFKISFVSTHQMLEKGYAIFQLELIEDIPHGK